MDALFFFAGIRRKPGKRMSELENRFERGAKRLRRFFPAEPNRHDGYDGSGDGHGEVEEFQVEESKAGSRIRMLVPVPRF